MKPIHEGMVSLAVQGHHHAVSLLEEPAPSEARHRIEPWLVGRVHKAGEGDPGYGCHEEQLILPGTIIQNDVRLYGGDALRSPGGESREMLSINHCAEAKQVILGEYGCGWVDSLMLDDLAVANTVAELGDGVGSPGDYVHDRHADRITLRLNSGVEVCQVDIGTHAEVRVVKGAVKGKVITPRPGTQINLSHRFLPQINDRGWFLMMVMRV